MFESHKFPRKYLILSHLSQDRLSIDLIRMFLPHKEKKTNLLFKKPFK